jgi:hypothetical protein
LINTAQETGREKAKEQEETSEKSTMTIVQSIFLRAGPGIMTTFSIMGSLTIVLIGK